MSNTNEKTSKNMSEFNTNLESARKYVADQSEDNLSAFQWILTKSIPKIHEVLEGVYSTPNVKVKGVTDKADAARKSLEVLADTISDTSVDESNFMSKLESNLKDFYTPEAVKEVKMAPKEEAAPGVVDVAPDAADQISPLKRITNAKEAAVLLMQFERGDWDDTLDADISSMDDEEKKHVERVKQVRDYVYGDGKKMVDELAAEYVEALFPSFKASVHVMEDDGSTVSDVDIKDIIKKSVVSRLVALPNKAESAFDAAVIGDVAGTIRDTYPKSEFLIKGDATLLTKHLEGDPDSKQQKFAPSKQQRDEMYANAEDFIQRNNPVIRVAHAGELLPAFLATIHSVANDVIESYSTSEKNRDFLESHGIDKSDLVQFGLVQYLKALQLYDPKFVNEEGQKTKFNTYLTTFVRQRLLNVISGEKSQAKSQTVKEKGKVKHVPLQRLDAPMSTGDEGEERGLGSTLTGDEGADTTLLMEQEDISHSELVVKAREFLHKLINRPGMPASNVALIDKLFDAEVAVGFKGINFSNFAKENGVAGGTPTVWEGKYIIPSILFAAGKITEEEALAYSRSTEGVHKKLHTIMKSDYYDKNAVVPQAPYFTLETPNDPNNTKYAQTATSEVVGYSPEELAAKLRMINYRIGEVNMLFGHDIAPVKTTADIVETIKKYPKTMFGIVKSVEHRPTESDIKRLVTTKVNSPGSLRTHTEKLVANLYDLLCGFSDRDLASNIKELLTMTTTGSGKNMGKTVPVLSTRAKDILTAFVKRQFGLPALAKIKANDMEINESLRELNTVAYDLKVGIDLQMEELMADAADVFLAASDDEIRAAKAKVLKAKNPTLKKIFSVMTGMNFSTDSVVALSMQGISIHEIFNAVKLQIIPLIKSPKSNVDTSPNVLDKPLPGEIVEEVAIKERPSLERQLEQMDKEEE